MSQKPTTPISKSHELYSICNRRLGKTWMASHYQRSTRQLERWAADPKRTEHAQNNPLDRLEIMLDELCARGFVDDAQSAVAYLAEVVGCELYCTEDGIPDKATLNEELLDDYDAINAYAKGVRDKEKPAVVQKLKRKAKEEINQTYTKYLETL